MTGFTPGWAARGGDLPVGETEMTITVRGLLDRPRLQLTLVGGAAGLDREITWAHASDLPTPWDYLGPGELLLTNGTGIGASPDAQTHFAERLARIGASGLVVGLGTGGAPVTAELAERAGELELPLLTVPYSIRFSDIVRAVARSEEHTSELQSPCNLVCRLLLEKKKKHIFITLLYKKKKQNKKNR